MVLSIKIMRQSTQSERQISGKRRIYFTKATQKSLSKLNRENVGRSSGMSLQNGRHIASDSESRLRTNGTKQVIKIIYINNKSIFIKLIKSNER